MGIVNGHGNKEMCLCIIFQRFCYLHPEIIFNYIFWNRVIAIWQKIVVTKFKKRGTEGKGEKEK